MLLEQRGKVIASYKQAILFRLVNIAQVGMTGDRFPVAAEVFSSLVTAYVPASCSLDTGFLFSGTKRQWREASGSPPSSSEIRNSWSCTSSPSRIFISWCLIKH
jgi:hypothetical protein